MKYVNVPKHIGLEALQKNGFCLAPSKYTSFYPDDEKRFGILGQLVKLRNERIAVKSHQEYVYIEIGDINVNTGVAKYNRYLGIRMPTKSPLRVKYDDILISTVRTYRKGIALVRSHFEDIGSTSALLVISEVEKPLTKEYVFAIARSDFFVEQILSFQNRGMYPRLDAGTIDNVYVPLPRTKGELRYITDLQKSLLNKEYEIQQKMDSINRLIEAEMGFKSETNTTHNYPTIKDIMNVGRLDTGPYTSSFKDLDSKIRTYKNGSQTLTELGYQISRGQNLQVSSIGRSSYSEKYQSGFYKLVLSKHFTERMTVENYQYLGNAKKLKTIKQGDIIFSCRGDLGRVFVSCEDMDDVITNIDNVHIRNPLLPLEHKILVGTFLNYLRMSNYLSSISIQGSGAGSFTKYHFDMIQIPNFSANVRQKIADLYFNKDLKKRSSMGNMASFLQKDDEWNRSAGIFQLDKSAKLIGNRLAGAIDNVIWARSQDEVFDFYS